MNSTSQQKFKVFPKNLNLNFANKIILSKKNIEKINKHVIIKRSESTGYLSKRINNFSPNKKI